MGQTESRKVKRNKKSLVFPKSSPEFMENFPKNNSVGDNKGKDGGGGKKHGQSKGVAMSFGFRKRPAVTSNASASTVAQHSEFACVNNKPAEQHALPRRTIINRASPVEKEEPVAKQTDIQIDGNRFGFRSKPPQDSIKTNIPDLQISHPVPEPRFVLNRPKNAYNREPSFNNPSHANMRPQLGKYTLQSTELPHLEPVRVIESKIEKTIINTRRKTANSRQLFERAFDNDHFYDYQSPKLANRSVQNNNSGVHPKIDNLNAKKNHASYQEGECFNNNRKNDELPDRFPSKDWSDNCGESESDYQEKSRTSSSLDGFPQPDIQKTFFKLKLDEISKNDSQSDLWDNAGEAMALDISQLGHKSNKIPKYNDAVSSILQVSPTISPTTRALSPLRLLPSLKSPDSNLVNEDLNFITVSSANATGMLLDDEILSPIESLSSSEAETNTKSSLSKDINDKSPNSSPPSPTNISSMSLVEEKDFLIDDEIADQPGLTFKNATGRDGEDANSNKFRYEGTASRSHMFKIHKKQRVPESSPLSIKNRRLFTKSNRSLDSLSSCESICSDDFVMDYDSSHTNDVNDFQRSTSKSFEKPSLFQNGHVRDSAWLEQEIEYPSFTSTFCDTKNMDSSNYNFNNGFTLNLSVKQSPTIQKDVRDIKKLLVKLKLLLNDTDIQNPFRDVISNQDEYLSCHSDRINENVDNANVVEKELADLRRQVLFLQVQLENKEESLTSLQKKITDLSIQNHQTTFAERNETEIGNRTHCNQATQTNRIIV